MRNSHAKRTFESLEPRHALDGEPVLLADVVPGGASSDPAEFVAAGDHVYFVAKLENGSRGLWRTDATGGASPVEGLVLGPRPLLAEMGGDVYATARDPSSPGELLRVDGVTGAVTTLYDSPTNSRIEQLHALADRVFFAADNDLWVTDGTAEGTDRVEAVSNVTRYLGVTDFSLYFVRSSSQLWRTDGTEAGTMLLTNVDPVQASTWTAFLSSGDTAYFAHTVIGGGSIWRTNGTPEGTTKFSDRAFDAPGMAVVNGVLFFVTSPAMDTWELRQLGPTDQASTLVKQFVNLEWPTHFTAFDGKLYFENRRLGPSSLWVSDGTAEGTQALVSTTEDESPHFIDQTIVAGGRLYVIDHGGRGETSYRLWESDGTPAGTRQIANLGQALPSQLTAIGDSLYFGLHTESMGTEPWILQPESSLPGDVNSDGLVDLEDFAVLKDRFGTTSELGDLDGNGKVDLSDFGLLKQAFAAPGAVALSAAAIRAAAIDLAIEGSLEDGSGTRSEGPRLGGV